MNRQEILNAIKCLACSQGSYGRLYNALTSGDADAYLDELEAQGFSDIVDMVLYIEG